MIKDRQLTLVSNFETYKVLKEKGVDSLLWEDCYDKSDLLRLHRDFKTFCNEWYYDERGNDCSVYDGMSIGTAISNFLSYDLETWIRVFYLFEYLASNKTFTKFYVLNKNYFPSEVYEFVDIINKVYDPLITIISLDLTDSGIETSVNQIVSVQRCSIKLKKSARARSIRLLDYVKNIFIPIRQEKIRCLVLHIRNPEEYLGSFLANRQKTGNLRLFFDAHYFARIKIFMNDLLYNKISFICDKPYRMKMDEQLIEAYINRLLQCGKDSLKKIELLGVEGNKIFQKILFEYLRKTLYEQIVHYSYLSRIIKKYRINATFCDGYNTPATYYCKHLMNKQGDHSYFMSHGLMAMDKKLIIGIKNLAHYYFYYSESEKNIFSETYNIPPERFYPISFLEKNNNEFKSYHKVTALKILILLDNFQVGLNSRINYFKSFTALYETLKDLSINNITVRPHGAFFNYYSFSDVTDEDKKRFFYSLPIQNRSEVPLKEVINEYDVVIGPLTSCILEAMWANVFFIPFIPDYFPARTLKEIIKMQWFPELYPKPCQSIDQLKETLSTFVRSPEAEYTKYLQSVRKVGNSNTPHSFLWETIAKTSK